MRNFSIPILALLFAFSLSNCTSSGTSSGSAFDSAGYEVIDLGGGIEKLTKKTADGTLVEEGFLYNGQKNGTWSTYHEDGERVKLFTSYINGTLSGPSLEMSRRGQIDSKKSYGNNTLHGLSSTYKFGRAVTEIPYTLGKIDGKYREYQDGNLHKEIDYADGKKNGKMLYYDADGKITVEYVYKNDEKVSGGMVEPK